MPRIHIAALAAALLLTACAGDSVSPDNNNNNNQPKPPAAISTIDLAPAAQDIVIGRNKTLVATPRDAAGKALTGRAFTWSSSDTVIARVDGNGVVTGVALGMATISVGAEGKNAQAAITVKEVTVASVVVAPTTPTVNLGETVTLTASVRDDNNSILTGRALSWSSNAPTTASVDSLTGVVTALAGGTATITAASEGVKGIATITVHVPVATVTVAPALDTVEAYDPTAMTAILRDARNNVLAGRVVRWTSSNPTIAAVDSVTGVLTGFDRGTVTITATSEQKNGSASRVIVIKYRSVAAGTMHACDIASGGFVWCWGLNGREGRIGSATLGDEAMSATPVLVPNTGWNAIRFTQLSSYGTHTCGIATTSKAYCWGNNSWSQLGTPDGSQSSAPVAVSGNLSFRQITTGGDHSCGVTVDNRAYCWGHNDWRQFAAATPGVSATPVAVAPELSFATLAAGTSFTCGVTTTGAAYCWGASGAGQLGNGAPISYGNTFSVTPVAVATAATLRTIDAGLGFGCALSTTNQALCWGNGTAGRLGNGSTNDSSTPVVVANGIAFSTLSTGQGHSCGVATDASLWCWGGNGNGQLGAAAPATSSSPIRAGGSMKFAEVSASGVSTGFGVHTCAVSADRLTAYCFGRNDVGQLGNGVTTTAAAVNGSPTIVVGQKPLP